MRALGFLASFVAVVAGCVAFVGWLDAKDVPIWVIGISILAIAVTLHFIRSALVHPSGLSASERDSWLVNAVLVLAVVGLGFAVVAERDLVAFVFAIVIFAAFAGPLILDLYEKDKASRKVCPDCCEEVKVGARVCRYCGYRWERG